MPELLSMYDYNLSFWHFLLFYSFKKVYSSHQNPQNEASVLFSVQPQILMAAREPLLLVGVSLTSLMLQLHLTASSKL